MAYNRKNLLERIIQVQEVYQAAKQPGISHAWVYREKIYPVFKISLKTLENYLAIPAKAELKKLEEKHAQQQNKNKAEQGSMEFPEHNG